MRGDVEAADHLFKESLAIRQELNDKEGIAETLEGLAWIARIERATLLWRSAEALRAALGTPRLSTERELTEQTLAAIEAQHGSTTFRSVWLEQPLSIDEVLAYALSDLA